MSDLKLFRIDDGGAVELEGRAAALEKSLQELMERNLEAMLGIRFLASEFSTGPKHGGRIDSLGLDENGTPVILEYKRARNENVINQGLFYLDWLMDHQADFRWLVMERLGKEAADSIDWSSPRLLCIAGDFTRYDVHAVQQMDRAIELMRYRRFGDELLLLEWINPTPSETRTTEAKPAPSLPPGGTPATKATYKSVSQYLEESPQDLQDLYDELKTTLTSLGDDIQIKVTHFYIAFKRLKNFACVEVHPKKGCLTAYLKVNPDEVALEDDFTRDVRNVGHYGTGDLEVILRSRADLDRAHDLFLRSYEAS